MASCLVLGVLALIVVVSAAYTISNRTIADRRHELADVQARAQASAAKAAALDSCTNFSTVRQKRSETVRSLAGSRFDWSHAPREIARTNGVHHAYTGNVPDLATSSTYCASCGKVVVEREGYAIGTYRLTDDGCCEGCGARCVGFYDGPAGSWGARRQPVRLHPRT